MHRNGMDALIAHARATLGISRAALLGRNTSRDMARPRQVVAWFAVHVYAMSTASVGRAMERDHTTIMHSRAVINDLLDAGDCDVACLVSLFDRGRPLFRVPAVANSRRAEIATPIKEPATASPPPRRKPTPPPVIRHTPHLLATTMTGPLELNTPNRRAGR